MGDETALAVELFTPSDDPEQRARCLEVVERVPLEVLHGTHNERYLQTKRDRMGHLILAEASAHDRAVLSEILAEE